MDPRVESLPPHGTGLPLLERQSHDGIERVVYRPVEGGEDRPPLVFVHDMWHGAFCWREWQIQFAELGWESSAFSLPGHGESAPGRWPQLVTQGYYLRSLRAELERWDRRPVLVGHSLGAGLIQRLLKEQDDFPAAVMLAPIFAREMLSVILNRFREDPWGSIRGVLTGSATPCIRNAELVRRMFLSESSMIEPEELRSRLSPESLLVLVQHNPPFWSPPREPQTPLLWLAPDHDTLMKVGPSLRSAQVLGAQAEIVPDTAHDLMFDRRSPLTIQRIHDWLLELGVRTAPEALSWPDGEPAEPVSEAV